MKNEEAGRFGNTAVNAKKTMQKKLEQVVHALPEMNQAEIASDVNGSYTGIARDGDRPVQDADDL